MLIFLAASLIMMVVFGSMLVGARRVRTFRLSILRPGILLSKLLRILGLVGIVNLVGKWLDIVLKECVGYPRTVEVVSRSVVVASGFFETKRIVKFGLIGGFGWKSYLPDRASMDPRP